MSSSKAYHFHFTPVVTVSIISISLRSLSQSSLTSSEHLGFHQAPERRAKLMVLGECNHPTVLFLERLKGLEDHTDAFTMCPCKIRGETVSDHGSTILNWSFLYLFLAGFVFLDHRAYSSISCKSREAPVAIHVNQAAATFTSVQHALSSSSCWSSRKCSGSTGRPPCHSPT